MAKKSTSHRSILNKSDVFHPRSSIMDNAPDRDFTEKPSVNTVRYTLIGKHDSLDNKGNPVIDDDKDNELVFAKIVTIKNRKKYFVKRGDNGQLFNPIGLYEEGTHNKYRRKAGKAQWNFSEVGVDAFQFYLTFLKTRNKAYLTNAQREAF